MDGLPNGNNNITRGVTASMHRSFNLREISFHYAQIWLNFSTFAS